MTWQHGVRWLNPFASMNTLIRSLPFSQTLMDFPLNYMKNKLTLLFCLLCLGAYAQKLPVFVTDSLDSYVTRGMKQWDIPGVAVAIVKDGKVVVMKGYGVKEVGSPDRV